MKTVVTHPSTWLVPTIHPDWGVDSLQVTQMLKEVATDIIDSALRLKVQLCVDEEDGVIYCEVLEDGNLICEIHCVEPLRTDSVQYLVLAEPVHGPEYEFSVTRRGDVLALVREISSGHDLAALQARAWPQ